MQWGGEGNNANNGAMLTPIYSDYLHAGRRIYIYINDTDTTGVVIKTAVVCNLICMYVYEEYLHNNTLNFRAMQ